MAKVLMIAADGFEEAELFEPKKALEEAGAEVTLASITRDAIQGMVQDSQKGKTITPDLLVGEVRAEDYDALVLPGGVGNPDKLRMDEQAVGLARSFMEADKPVASICHGPWLLVEANVLKGRRLTSWPSLKTDIENAGGTRLDQEVVVDGNLITSRKPDDIPAFNQAILEAVGLKEPVAA
jgi:protease I